MDDEQQVEWQFEMGDVVRESGDYVHTWKVVQRMVRDDGTAVIGVSGPGPCRSMAYFDNGDPELELA